MISLPAPPADFPSLKLIVEAYPADALLRVASTNPATWCRFNREPRNRFDAPSGEFGVLYTAFDLATAFAETVLREKPFAAEAGPSIPIALTELRDRTVVSLRASRPLRLIQLHEYGLAAAHVDNRISTVDDYPTTRLWAHAFHEHPEQVDGVLYLSRFMGARRSVALFDRCADAVSAVSTTSLMRHPDFAALLDNFKIAIDRDA